MRTHGNAGTYRAGCRCEPCTKANREKHAALRGKKPPKHGTLSAYRNYGCRCEPCRAAGSTSNRDDRQKILDGSWEVSHGTSQRADLGCACEECGAVKEQQLRAAIKRNDESRTRAHKSGARWTGAEMEIVMRDDLSIKQLAALLGRTLFAVQVRRSRIVNDPKWSATAGVHDRMRDE